MSKLEPYHFDLQGEVKKGKLQNEQPYFYFYVDDIVDVPDIAYKTWTCLLRQWVVSKDEWVSVPKWIRLKAGMDRWKLKRDLKVLKDAGFIEVIKAPGKSTKVRRVISDTL